VPSACSFRKSILVFLNSFPPHSLTASPTSAKPTAPRCRRVALVQAHEAEDLFQQTWLRVVEKIRSFDASRNFDAWLFTLARNLAIDHLRRIRPQSLDEPLANSWHSETVADRIPCKDHTPLDHALAGERRTEISEAMAGLPMMYREVLTLRFEEEMKIEEIAQVTAVPVSTVKSRLRRSLEQLRYALEAR
jgi:RNA polymerase sigma-70 factor (ECF subfamily)